MNKDHQDFPLPDPAETPWLATFIRILATGAVRDRPYLDVDRVPSPETEEETTEE